MSLSLRVSLNLYLSVAFSVCLSLCLSLFLFLPSYLCQSKEKNEEVKGLILAIAEEAKPRGDRPDRRRRDRGDGEDAGPEKEIGEDV